MPKPHLTRSLKFAAIFLGLETGLPLLLSMVITGGKIVQRESASFAAALFLYGGISTIIAMLLLMGLGWIRERFGGPSIAMTFPTLYLIMSTLSILGALPLFLASIFLWWFPIVPHWVVYGLSLSMPSLMPRQLQPPWNHVLLFGIGTVYCVLIGKWFERVALASARPRKATT